MFSLTDGRPIAKFAEGKLKRKCTLNIIEDKKKDKYAQTFGSEIEFKGSSMIPVPNIDSRDIIYIAGSSGSGKSTMASKYLETFQHIFPNSTIFVFSRKDSGTDPAFRKLRLQYIPINDELVANSVDITKDCEEGSCFLFDDIATIMDDQQKKTVYKIMCDIMEVGRAKRIYCIITNHLINPNDKKIGRIIFNEMHDLVIFPKSGNFRAMTYCLDKYFGYDKQTINKILKLPSRWVLINKQYPNYVLYDKGAFIP